MKNRKLVDTLHEKFMYGMMPTIFLIGAIAILYKANFTNYVPDNKEMSRISLNIISVLILIATIYSYKKIIGYLKFTQIISLESTESKEEIIKKLAENFNWNLYPSNNNDNEYNFIKVKNFTWNYRGIIIIEDESFFINVQDYYGWLIFDFGMNKKIRSKIDNKITELLEEKKASL